MNCIIHNDTPAVGSCGKCSMGLCSNCATSAMTFDSKPYCKNCAFNEIEAYEEALRVNLGAVKFKKTTWSVILALGLFVAIFAFTSHGAWIVLTFLIWGCAGFVDRVQAEQNLSTKQAFKDAIREERDGIFWTLYGKAGASIIRGFFFPIPYTLFMLKGDKDVRAELARCEELKQSLQA